MNVLEICEDKHKEDLEKILDECAQDRVWYLQGVPGASEKKAKRYKKALDEYQEIQNAVLAMA